MKTLNPHYRRFSLAAFCIALTGFSYAGPAWSVAEFRDQYLHISEVHSVNQGVYRDVALKLDNGQFVLSHLLHDPEAPPPTLDDPATYSHQTGLLHLPDVSLLWGGVEVSMDVVLKLSGDEEPARFDFVSASPTNGADADLSQAYDTPTLAEAIQTLMDTHGVVGLSAAVIKDGEPLWSRGFGYADQQQGIEVTANTPFRLGSVSKAVLGVALVQHLGSDLQLDQPINQHLPFVVQNPSAPGTDITLRHLVEHRSGLSDGQAYDCSYFLTEFPELPLYEALGVFPDGSCNTGFSRDTELFLEQFTSSGVTGHPLPNSFNGFAPGAVEEYSNIGAALAALVLEQAQAEHIETLVRQGISDPLGMVHTGYGHGDFSAFKHRARLYLSDQGQTLELPEYEFPSFADGGLHSSANDLARLLAALSNSGELDGARILPNTGVQRLFGLSASGAVEPIFWESTDGLIYQDGSDPGVATLVLLHPESGFGVVVLANTVNDEGDQPAVAEIAELLLQLGLFADTTTTD